MDLIEIAANTYPYPIARAAHVLQSHCRSDWDRRLLSLTYLSECTVGFVCYLCVSDYLHHKESDKNLDNNFRKHFDRPSMGHLIGFARSFLKRFEENDLFVPELKRDVEPLIDREMSRLVGERNQLGHPIRVPQDMMLCRGRFESLMGTMERVLQSLDLGVAILSW